MALINCPECGKEISDKATSCPHCGNPINPGSNTQPESGEYLCCPICHSRELHAEQKGFSGGKAFTGAIVAGGIGLLAGTIGSKDVDITCLKCGNRFKAGDAEVEKVGNSLTDFETEVANTYLRVGMLQTVKFYIDEKHVDLQTAKREVESILAKKGLMTPVDNHHAPTSNNNNGGGCASVVLILVVVGGVLAFLF